MFLLKTDFLKIFYVVIYFPPGVWFGTFLNEHVREETNNLGSDQIRHKSACAVSEES